MTKHDTERVDRLLFAELTYKPDVGARYTAASNTRMRALKALLLAAQAGAIEGAAEVFGEVEDQL